MNINPNTVSNLAKRYNLETKKLGYHKIEYPLSGIKNALSIGQTNQFRKNEIDLPDTKTYNDFWKLDWDEFIVACDTHSPYAYLPIWDKMLKVADKYKIKNFVHAGDFWDQSQASVFWVAGEDMVTFDKEVAATKELTKSLTGQFKDVRFFLGSHDIRFWKLFNSLGKCEDYKTVWDMLENDRIKVSRYRYCEIGRYWRINHPKNTVRVGGLPAIRMTAKFNRSVIFGHGHWQGWVFAPDGKHLLMAPGCLCDPKKISYKNIWDTSHDEWVTGFILVRDKIRATVCNEYSDWDIILKH